MIARACTDIYLQAWTMACAAVCLLVPIMSLPTVFGGIRAKPLHTGTLTLQAAQRPPGAEAPTEAEQDGAAQVLGPQYLPQCA